MDCRVLFWGPRMTDHIISGPSAGALDFGNPHICSLVLCQALLAALLSTAIVRVEAAGSVCAATCPWAETLKLELCVDGSFVTADDCNVLRESQVRRSSVESASSFPLTSDTSAKCKAILEGYH